jgi:hypothetical protein
LATKVKFIKEVGKYSSKHIISNLTLLYELSMVAKAINETKQLTRNKN